MKVFGQSKHRLYRWIIMDMGIFKSPNVSLRDSHTVNVYDSNVTVHHGKKSGKRNLCRVQCFRILSVLFKTQTYEGVCLHFINITNFSQMLKYTKHPFTIHSHQNILISDSKYYKCIVFSKDISYHWSVQNTPNTPSRFIVTKYLNIG